jgi:hypothetical protein
MEKLDSDIWADVLLPMLRKNKSAAAVAASCSTLRKLCQGAVRHLIFTPATRSGDLATVKRNVAALHQHFSALKGVGIALARDDVYVLAPAIMEGLSRQVRQFGKSRAAVRLIWQVAGGSVPVQQYQCQLQSAACIICCCVQVWYGSMFVCAPVLRGVAVQ